MEDLSLQKPSVEEWLHWAQVALDRLTSCVHIYAKPPYEDVFMAEAEKQTKNGQVIAVVKRLHGALEGADFSGTRTQEAAQDEKTIQELSPLLRDVLTRLPDLSDDMQKLLKSPWCEKCNGRLASELFRGPMGNEAEGIGSGRPEQGRLPQQLAILFEREQMGETRPPRMAGESHPHRHDESRHRWAENNSHFLRSAGRVE